MSDSIKFELKGAKEADELLKSLTTKDKIEIYYKLNRKGANVVKNKLIEKAPSERIKKNIKIKRSKLNPTAVLIGFLKKVFFVQFLEFGTEIRKTKGKGKVQKVAANRGKVNPKPFVQAAHDEAVQELQKKLGQNYQRELNNVLKSKIRQTNNKIKKMKA